MSISIIGLGLLSIPMLPKRKEETVVYGFSFRPKLAMPMVHVGKQTAAFNPFCYFYGPAHFAIRAVLLNLGFVSFISFICWASAFSTIMAWLFYHCTANFCGCLIQNKKHGHDYFMDFTRKIKGE